MKKNILLSLLLIAGSHAILYSQITNRGEIISPEFDRFYKDFKNQQIFNASMEDNYDGSPYLNKEFESGKIILSDGKEYNNIMLRYNIYNDQFEFSNDDKVLALEKDSQFKDFILGDKKFCYKTYLIKDKEWEGYLLKLVEDKYSLYLKYNMILKEGEDARPFQAAKKPRFLTQKPYYMIGSDARGIIQVKSLKDFYKAFPDLQGSVKDFAGREKLKLKSEDDYLKLLEFINSKND